MQGPKWLVLLIIIVYETLCGHWCCLGQVLYLGRAPCTKETLPDFRERCRVTRHSRVFRGLTGYQRTPGFWGVILMAKLAPFRLNARIAVISNQNCVPSLV